MKIGKLLKKIFYVEKKKGNHDKIYIDFHILGLKLRIIDKTNEIIRHINSHISLYQRIEKKLSMPDNIWQIDNVKFFVPYYPIDIIQSHIVDKNEFFEQDILKELEQHISKNAVILDVGANIGNHSVYWGTNKNLNVQKVLSFEPVDDTFRILTKNIELNHLQDKVEIYNFGLGEKDSKAEIEHYSRDNIGGTSLQSSDTGNITLYALDSLELDKKLKKIDFIKIDIEGMEPFFFKGAKNTLMKFKPKIFVEVFEKNQPEVFALLESYGYKMTKEYPDFNFLFEAK